jgi:membrane protein DedA with SNARE-associated domain
MDFFEEIIRNTDERGLTVFVFLFSFLEYVLPMVPGDLSLAFGIFMAVYGGYSISLIFASSIVGGTLGALSVLLLGRYIRKKYDTNKLGDLLGRFYRDSYGKLERGIELVNRYGFLIIAINRFIPVLRGPIVLAAGYSRVSLVVSLSGAIISAILFNAMITAVSIIVGRNFDAIKGFLSYYFEGVILLVLCVFISYKIISHLRRRRI